MESTSNLLPPQFSSEHLSFVKNHVMHAALMQAAHSESEPCFLPLTLAHLASTALRADSRLCSAVRRAVLALPPFSPPKRPKATAWGFFCFFFAIGEVPIA